MVRAVSNAVVSLWGETVRLD